MRLRHRCIHKKIFEKSRGTHREITESLNNQGCSIQLCLKGGSGFSVNFANFSFRTDFFCGDKYSDKYAWLM